MTKMAGRVRNMGESIFSEMTLLAIKHEAINLGQGFPDFPAPDFVKAAAQKAIEEDVNQYAPSAGHIALRERIAAKVARYYGLEVDPAREVAVTVGATEAIFASILGLVDPGDEVIIFDPAYDSYRPAIEFAGGVARMYTLEPPDWAVDADRLGALFNEKTKLIIINTPHNPTGKVFGESDLRLIADLCQQHDVIAVTDEVYEHIIFDGLKHVPMATLPGMGDRTVTISSLGKSFSVTGWKVGWVVGAADLCTAVFRARQFVTFGGASPLQMGAAAALEAEPAYYAELTSLYEGNRDFLVGALEEAGLKPIVPQGTYFVMVDISQLPFKDDRAFCHFLTKEIGVAAIPPSAFYADPAQGAGLARFAFCKTREMLEAAAVRLQALKAHL